MRIFTLIFVFTLALQSFAYDSSLKLNLQEAEGEYFKVVLGGQNHYVKDFLNKDEMYAGRHTLKVYQRFKKPAFLGSGYGYRRIYNGYIDVPQKSVVYASINRHNRLNIDEIIPIDQLDDETCDHPDHHDDGSTWAPGSGNIHVINEMKKAGKLPENLVQKTSVQVCACSS